MIYDEVLRVLRGVVVSVSGLPTERRWLNTTGAAPSGPFIDDGITALDSTFAECGPDAMRRCEMTYRVSIRVPSNTDAHAALALAGSLEGAFAAMQVTVDGNPVEVLSTRAGPAMPESAWLHVPVSVSLTFDHQ